MPVSSRMVRRAGRKAGREGRHPGDVVAAPMHIQEQIVDGLDFLEGIPRVDGVEEEVAVYTDLRPRTQRERHRGGTRIRYPIYPESEACRGR